jgi:hypothetical protein
MSTGKQPLQSEASLNIIIGTTHGDCNRDLARAKTADEEGSKLK